jgi:hypothetical protein
MRELISGKELVELVSGSERQVIIRKENAKGVPYVIQVWRSALGHVYIWCCQGRIKPSSKSFASYSKWSGWHFRCSNRFIEISADLFE